MMKATLMASVAGLAHGECCKTCTGSDQKYYSVDMKHGHCGETCVYPGQFLLYKAFEKNLTIADGSTGYTGCADLGWPKYQETVSHGDPLKLLVATLDLYGHNDAKSTPLEEPNIASQIVPLSNLNFDAYLGRWYQTYVSLSAPFQSGATCVTADYGIASDGKTVTVKNKSLFNDPSIGFLSVEGYAARNPNGSGELQVELGRPGRPVTTIPEWNENPSNYIVAAVGPIVEGLYDYAIVGDPAGTMLYVLARDVGRFEEQHKEKVLQQTQDLGFTDDNNRPRKTIQEGCSYSEPDEVASGKISNIVVQYKAFEKNLTIADGSTGYTGCAYLGWPKYQETVSHGDPLKLLTLDLFGHDDSATPFVEII